MINCPFRYKEWACPRNGIPQLLALQAGTSEEHIVGMPISSLVHRRHMQEGRRGKCTVANREKGKRRRRRRRLVRKEILRPAPTIGKVGRLVIWRFSMKGKGEKEKTELMAFFAPPPRSPPLSLAFSTQLASLFSLSAILASSPHKVRKRRRQRRDEGRRVYLLIFYAKLPSSSLPPKRGTLSLCIQAATS